METALQPIDKDHLNQLEKEHWPLLELGPSRIGQKALVKVRVGQAPHPQATEHQIVFIELFLGPRPVGKVFLDPSRPAEAEFTVTLDKDTELIAQAFCNVHGLWENKIKVEK